MFALLPVYNGFAQKSIEPSSEDIDIANKLKEKFEDKNLKIVVRKSVDQFSFFYNKKEAKVGVEQYSTKSFINLSSFYVT